ncbi:hypothetical protein CVT24_010906 [Panaeolus cyanescens]|uniref:Tyr recombinase domain-containing protein n=1 Tax=Panaeolus cyanescens TaxID=181874 RepID=A0A409X8S3_9AGAR|nr:hypothetical protein CVT24_010906 [Panaeolus cyanescens]
MWVSPEAHSTPLSFNLRQQHIPAVIPSRIPPAQGSRGQAARMNLMLSPHLSLSVTPACGIDPSVLRPHCAAEDRLRRWRPLRQGIDASLVSQIDADRIYTVLSGSWQISTRRTYGAGLLLFHTYCDRKVPPVPEAQRAPIHAPLLLDFLTACAGVYAGSSVKNYAYGLRAWHTVHALTWSVDEVQLQAALSAAEKLAPPSSRREKRAPVTVDYLVLLAPHFDLSAPLDAAVFACLTTVFWSLSRLGEFVVPGVDSFDPLRHIKAGDVTQGSVSRFGLMVTSFAIPSTKVAPVNGETVQWSRQEGPADPDAAFRNHMEVNRPNPQDHLFSWRNSRGVLTPLSRYSFMRRVGSAVSKAGVPRLQGHGLRIGGVLEFLLRGVPFDVVKEMGRWSSNAFSIYLRKHADILAPYIQDAPLLEPFTRVAMPPGPSARS